MQRSHSFGLLTNGASEDEIRRSITPAIAENLQVALESVVFDSRPASDDQLMAAVAAICGLIGQDWRAGHRDEFMALVVQEMRKFPGYLVLDALNRARQRVTAGRLLVAWVVDDIQGKADALRLETERLTRLAQIAADAGS